MKIWDKLPNLKYVILYDDDLPYNLPKGKEDKIMTLSDFLKIGASANKPNIFKELLYRIKC